MESAGIDFFNRVRNGYIEISKQEPNRVKLISGKNTIEKIHDQIIELIDEII